MRIAVGVVVGGACLLGALLLLNSRFNGDRAALTFVTQPALQSTAWTSSYADHVKATEVISKDLRASVEALMQYVNENKQQNARFSETLSAFETKVNTTRFQHVEPLEPKIQAQMDQVTMKTSAALQPQESVNNNSVTVVHEQLLQQCISQSAPLQYTPTMETRESFPDRSRKMLLDLLPETNVVVKPYTSCAVIANGGIMLEANGANIDEYDAIFRSNEGPTRGFAEHVGRRTTFRFYYGPNCGCMAQDEFSHTVCVMPIDNDTEEKIFIDKKRSWQWLYKDQETHFKSYKTLHSEFNKLHAEGDFTKPLHFSLLNVNLIKDFRKEIGPWPTTGLFAIRAALDICNCVDIFGYSAGRSIQSNRPFRYHYYDDYTLPAYQDKSKSKDKENPHKYDVEANWILRMVKEGKIRDMSFPKDGR